MTYQPNTLKMLLNVGGKKNPFWISGPCVIENREVMAKVAEELKNISNRHGVAIVFKSSFDKANRTSCKSYRGIGLEKGLNELLWVKRTFDLPILTDVHETRQVAAVAEVADIIQIPAFLSRQTDLIEAACKSGRLVNVKKGQFLSPANIKELIQKLTNFGAKDFWITERGVAFGYQRLVVDFAAFPEMETYGAKLILDITHSVQLPSAGDGITAGNREATPYLARCGAACGVRGFFAETHPDPDKALSDATTVWPLEQLEKLILTTKRIAEAAHG